MKRFVFISIFSFALCSFGQTDSLKITLSEDSVPNLTEFNLEDYELPPLVMIEEEEYNSKDYIRYMCFYSGVDFGLISLRNDKLPISTEQSFSVQLNLVEYKKQLIANRFGIFSGISLGYRQIGFQNNFTFKTAGSQTVMIPDSIDYLKNQLRTFYASLPIMFELNSKNTFNKNVHLAFGMQAGYGYANSTYQKHKTQEAIIIRKNSENIHINPYHLEATVRVGYQNITFFASRSLTPLFIHNKFQHEVYPIVVGASIVPANSKPHEKDNFDF